MKWRWREAEARVTSGCWGFPRVCDRESRVFRVYARHARAKCAIYSLVFVKASSIDSDLVTSSLGTPASGFAARGLAERNYWLDVLRRNDMRSAHIGALRRGSSSLCLSPVGVAVSDFNRSHDGYRFRRACHLLFSVAADGEAARNLAAVDVMRGEP